MTRVTMQTMSAAAQRNLQSSSARLAQFQQSAMDLKKIPNISADPAAAADAMAVRAQQAAAAQYGRNISDGTNWLSSADTALESSTALLRRAKDLTLQGANGATSDQGRKAIAAELDSIRKDLLGLANTQYLGRNIFAGNSSEGAAYTDNPLKYTGDASTVERRISANATIRVDADGAAIFGPDDEGNSVFGLLTKIADALRNGGDVAANIGTLDKAVGTVIDSRSALGSQQAQLLRAQTANANGAVDRENQRSSIEDLDLSKAILDVKTQELAYQAALSVTAKVLQPTLMDFLR